MPQPTLQVKDANSATQTVYTQNANGQATSANSQSIVGASDWVPALPTGAATSANQTAVTGTIGSSAPAMATEIGLQDSSGLLRVPLAVQFHNADNQALGSGYALNTGGVAQLLNGANGLDRQRETYADNTPSAGLAAGSQQLAGPPITGTITGSVTAGNRTVTVSTLTKVARGITYSIQVGSTVAVDTGASFEYVYVTAVNTGTPSFTAVFANSHSASTAFTAFAFDQARSSSIPDGSTTQGIPSGSVFLWNSALNSGNGGVEIERSAAGELDGANGSGTNIAAEYEWAAGGPPAYSTGLATGFAFIRARNVQGKGRTSATITTSVAGNSSIVFSTAATTNLLQPGQAITLTGGAAAETVFSTVAWVPGSSTTVPLQSAVVNAGQTTAAWDVFASQGPGLNGFTADGIGIEEEAVWDPTTKLYYQEVAANAGDGIAATNVVVENPGLWNGTNIDRAREVIGDAQAATGLPAEVPMFYNGTNYDRARSGLVAPQSAATGMANEIAVGYVQTSAPTLTNTNVAPLQLTTAGALRTDVDQLGGTNIVTAGVAGTLAVGGNIAVGTTPTLNPIPLVVDAGGLTRRVLSDTSGSLLVGSAASNNQTLGTQISPTTPAALVIKASAGKLYFLHVGNPNTSAVYVKLFNATTVTLGTTSATLNFYIPQSSSLAIPINDTGLYFSTGIELAVTGGPSLTDNTVITTGCEVNYSYN